ncbi:HAMP domain-containing histidine kinase [Streptomyces sp. NA02950]|uniref:sensor histidine kinase n=1 Tax=Streptomyces sp. NA02950 TaxID=2742137 RepID=UPI0015911CEF|nr:HAMP domain-containing sensor histidine kinase [Streptomyces sp. NA02950]QKV95099.1 HAMP domain-containing histidine kinase [Streptomyces sp. NA02950]
MRLTGGMSVRAKAVVAAAGTVTFAIGLCVLALVLTLQQNLRESAKTDARKTAVSVRDQLSAAGLHPGEPVVIMPDKVFIQDQAGREVSPTAVYKELPRKVISPGAEITGPPPRATESITTGSTYRVKVNPSTTALDNAKRLLLREVAPAAAGLVLFVAGLTWLLVGRALRPVAAIQREVTEITERDLHRRVPVPGARDEISRLARTMNATLDRLHQAMTRQRQFVADASHELRSPIAAVRAQLELAMARPHRTDWPSAVHKALRDTERLQAVASDLLLLARLDAQEAPPRSPVDLAALTAEEARRHPDTVTVTGNTADATAVVHGSRVQLSRLLTNLTDNARRHAHASVSLTVHVHGHSVELAVDDDGPGIPEADRERVFERFTRLDHARARQDGGTGLGLAIANDIAHAHGGTLTVHTSPTGGARLLLCLPRAGSG